MDVLFAIVKLNVFLKISGSNFDSIRHWINLYAIGGNPEEILEQLNQGLAKRVQDEMQRTLIEYYMSTLSLGVKIDLFTAIAGSKQFFDTTVEPGTNILSISTILPVGVTLLELSILIAGKLFSVAVPTAVSGFAAIIIFPPDLIPGTWQITVDSACPDVTFNITVTKINYTAPNIIQVFDVPWENKIYSVITYSNSTISDFNFSQPLKQITLNVTGQRGTSGFCNVTIPIELLDGNFTVWIDDKQINYSLEYNATHSSIYFTYNHSTHKMTIKGTTVIPEFPTTIFLSMLMIAMLILVAITKSRATKRKRKTTTSPLFLFSRINVYILNSILYLTFLFTFPIFFSL